MVRVACLGAVAAASLVLPFGHASPTKGLPSALQSRQQGYFPITGVQDGGVQPRLNIRELERSHPEMWTLFILATERLKSVDQEEMLSYYLVAGIHGQPYIPWDNVPGWSDEPSWGYCPHNGNLFATWHRPYMMLYEQLLHAHALEIVDEIADAGTKARYRDAASKLRLPYWDWAEKPPQGGHVIPPSIADDTLSLTFPNGTVATIVNPLRRYNFNPFRPDHIVAVSGLTFDLWHETYRNPTPYDSPNPVENITLMHQNVDGLLANSRSGLYKLFRSYQGFNQFSNQMHGYDRTIGNLETIHGTIHSAFNPGHMSPSMVASFDPIFWLHHSNVDRQIAIWQAIYPETYVQLSTSVYQTTYTYSSSAVQYGPHTALTPFHRNAEGEFWTSELVRDITKLGYTYPELEGRPSNETLKAAVKALYDDGTSGLLAKRQENSGEKTHREYAALFELPTGYTVSVSLGGDFVGSFSTMFNIGMQNNLVLNGLVDLSSAILKALETGALASADEETVVEYLKGELKWTITDTTHNVASPADLPDFRVEVFSQLETVPESDGEFPTILSTKTYSEITEG